MYHHLRVLIDTWWNVNSASQIRPLTQEAFNRYMVECESYGVFNALIFLTVLIDTWWNVNEELEWFVDTVISFNRYMVECEFVNDADCFFCIHSFNRYMVECESVAQG